MNCYKLAQKNRPTILQRSSIIWLCVVNTFQALLHFLPKQVKSFYILTQIDNVYVVLLHTASLFTCIPSFDFSPSTGCSWAHSLLNRNVLICKHCLNISNMGCDAMTLPVITGIPLILLSCTIKGWPDDTNRWDYFFSRFWLATVRNNFVVCPFFLPFVYFWWWSQGRKLWAAITVRLNNN